MSAPQEPSVWSYPAYGQQDWRYAVQEPPPPVAQAPEPLRKRGGGKKALLVIVGVLYAIFTAINIQFMTDDYPECRNPGSIMPSGQDSSSVSQ